MILFSVSIVGTVLKKSSNDLKPCLTMKSKHHKTTIIVKYSNIVSLSFPSNDREH